MIHNTTSATPRLDDYRKQVFLGLQKLQTRVSAAGGIEALFAPLLDGPKEKLARIEAGDDDDEDEDDAEPER